MEAAKSIHEISLNISFAFNDAKYSDRTLLLEIVDDDDSMFLRSAKRCRRILFDRELFSNDMRESEQKQVTLRIETSEEVSFMELLKYIYSNNLPTTLEALLDLLLTTDKFEVDSCLRDCTQALQKLPMTCESASLYLALPSCLVMSPIIQPFIDAAKKFIMAKFKDLDKFKEEALSLPLLGIQTLLSHDDLQVTSECVVYDFVLTWVRKHYSDLEERREILKTHLLHLVRFPLMTTTKLTEEVQTCSDIDPEVASKIVIRALGFRAETPHRRRCLAAQEGNTAASRQYVERAYKIRPNKVVEFAFPCHECIVYLDLAGEKLLHTIHEGDIRSENFHVGGLTLKLITRFYVYTKLIFFWLSLNVVESSACTVDYTIGLRTKPSWEFENLDTGRLTFIESDSGRCDILLSLRDWGEAKDNRYFINDVLHVKAKFTRRK